jgi:hypothetical protein
MATTAEPTTVDLRRWCIRPLPACGGDEHASAVADIQELESRRATAMFHLSVADSPEEFAEIEEIITDLDAQLDEANARLASATRDQQAAMARSDRMRGATKSLGMRRPVRARGTRRLGCGRPATRRTTSSAPARDGPGDSDEPPPARRGDRVGDTSRTRYSLREAAVA